MSITHTEVRRHPRWREQLGAAREIPEGTSIGVRLIAVVAFVIIATAIAVVLLRG
jgi:hypothetical protein